MSKEESKPDPFKNAVDGGTPEGSLLAIRQTYEIELKFRDDMIFELKKYVEELKLLFKTFKEAITKGDGLYSDMYWEPSELTPYQRALKELSELRKENEELKNIIRNGGLPNDCVAGWDEVKFCPNRQGEGNMCMHCMNF